MHTSKAKQTGAQTAKMRRYRYVYWVLYLVTALLELEPRALDMAKQVLHHQTTPPTLSNILILIIFGKKNAKADNIKNPTHQPLMIDSWPILAFCPLHLLPSPTV